MSFINMKSWLGFDLNYFWSFFYKTEEELTQLSKEGMSPELMTMLSKSIHLFHPEENLTSVPKTFANSSTEMLIKSATRISLNKDEYDAIYDPIINSIAEGLTPESLANLQKKWASFDNTPLSASGINFLEAFQEVINYQEALTASDHYEKSAVPIAGKDNFPVPPPGPPPLFMSSFFSSQEIGNLQEQIATQIEKMKENEAILTEEDVILREEVLEIEKIIHGLIEKFNEHPIFIQKYALLLRSVYQELKRNENLAESMSSLTDSRLFNNETSKKISSFVKRFKGSSSAQVMLLEILKKNLVRLQLLSSQRKEAQLANLKDIAKHIDHIREANQYELQQAFYRTKEEWLRVLPIEQFYAELRIVKKTALFEALASKSAFRAKGAYPLKQLSDLDQVFLDFKKFHQKVSEASSQEELNELQNEYLFWSTEFISHFPKGFDRQVLVGDKV